MQEDTNIANQYDEFFWEDDTGNAEYFILDEDDMGNQRMIRRRQPRRSPMPAPRQQGRVVKATKVKETGKIGGLEIAGAILLGLSGVSHLAQAAVKEPDAPALQPASPASTPEQAVVAANNILLYQQAENKAAGQRAAAAGVGTFLGSVGAMLLAFGK